MMSLISGVLVVVVLPILLTEFTELAPWLAAKVALFASRRLRKAEEVERYGEEWLADVAHAPGKLTKLAVALGHVVAALRLRRDLPLRQFRSVQRAIGTPHVPVVADESKIVILRRALTERRDAGGWPAAAAIVSQAGEEKTAFAQWVFDGLGGAFPAGSVVVDMSAAQKSYRSLAVLLRSLGARRIPVLPSSRRQLCRRLTARSPIQLVLDNANDDDALFGMLYAISAPSSVLVTRPTAPISISGVVRSVVCVDEFTEWQSIRLLAAYIGSYRTTREYAAAARLVRRCGYRPEAVQLVAAYLRANPNRTIRRLLRDWDRHTNNAPRRLPMDTQNGSGPPTDEQA